MNPIYRANLIRKSIITIVVIIVLITVFLIYNRKPASSESSISVGTQQGVHSIIGGI